MISFLKELKTRNSLLYYSGGYYLISAGFCVLMILFTDTQILGINAWIKPFKFFFSSVIFSWSIGWYMGYLKQQKSVRIYSWVVVIVLVFETTYIAIQTARGELSHFNVSSKFYGYMFSLMGFAITLMTLWTLYIGILFSKDKFPNLPVAYIWGIRLGIFMFVIFAIEGGLMGRYLSHTIGAPDGGPGLPLINWSSQFGDLRIAHFFGMHALQILPLVAFYVLKKTSYTIIFALLYFALTTTLLVRALMALPLIP